MYPCQFTNSQIMKVRLCILYFPRFHRGRGILPRNLRWNLKMMVSKRNLLFQGLHFRFHVKFRGVHQISFSCFTIHVCRFCLDLFFRCSRTKDVLKHFCIPFPRAAVRIVHTSTFSQSVQKFGEVGVKLMIVLDFIQLPYMPCLLSATHIHIYVYSMHIYIYDISLTYWFNMTCRFMLVCNYEVMSLSPTGMMVASWLIPSA